MTDINQDQSSIDAFPIPEGSVLLKTDQSSSLREFSINALKQILEERDLTLPLGPELDIENPKRLIILNRFAIQVVTTGITSDEISIPLEQWYKYGAAPQILLAAKVDEENNVVYFSGVLTGPEFKLLVKKHLINKDEVRLPIKEFKGGIDRLLRFVRILEPTAILRTELDTEASSPWLWERFSKRFKPMAAIPAFAAAAFILGPSIFRPRLLGNVVSISLSQTEIKTYTRGIATAAPLRACLLTPSFSIDNQSSIPIAQTALDQPLIFSPDPLNELTISKDGEILWSKNGTLEKRIEGPIAWPLEPIKSNEQYLLTIRPKGTSMGESAKVVVRGNADDSFQKLDDIVKSLGDNKSQWIKAVNQQLKKDKNIALTLLFSDKAPQSKILTNARKLILDRKGCL